MSESNDDKVEQYNRANRLKLRVGGTLTNHAPGRLDPKAIAAAEEIVQAAADESKDKISDTVEQLSAAWRRLRDMQDGDASDATIACAQKEVFFLAHEVKDMASLCGYGLITDFAESLRDYVERTDLALDARKVIVQAHVDTLSVALRSKIVESSHPMAIKLWDAIKAAIEKHG